MNELFPFPGISEQGLKDRLSLAIDAGIGCDAIEPGVKQGVRLELGQGLIGFQESVLRGIFGVSGIPEYVTAEVVDFVLVSEDDLSECGGIAFLESVYKIVVIRGLHKGIIAEKIKAAQEIHFSKIVLKEIQTEKIIVIHGLIVIPYLLPAVIPNVRIWIQNWSRQKQDFAQINDRSDTRRITKKPFYYAKVNNRLLADSIAGE